MSAGSIRIGLVASGSRRSPGTGRHFGPFHLARIRKDRARVISVGYLRFDRRDLELLREKGTRLNATVVGVVKLGPDVTPALAQNVFGRLRILGWRLGDKRTFDVL